MMKTFPEAVWSQRHADVLNVAASAALLPLSMFGGFPPTVAHADPGNAIAMTSSGNSATEKWYAEIEKKIRPGVSRQQAAVLVAKEQPQLQAAYIAEFRQQAAKR